MWILCLADDSLEIQVLFSVAEWNLNDNTEINISAKQKLQQTTL